MRRVGGGVGGGVGWIYGFNVGGCKTRIRYGVMN
jgi:hypothetical protein